MPQGFINVLWAVAKLVDNGLLDHGQVNEAVTALLPLVAQGGGHQAGFKPHGVVSLMWAVAFLGESIELKKISEILDALSFSEQYSVVQQTQLLSSFIVFMARNVSIRDQLISSMEVWYEALKQQSADNESKTTLAMAAVWLNQESNVIPSYKPNTSKLQRKFQSALANQYPNIETRQEFSLRNLPPVDVYLPELELAIEVQGPHHFTNNMNKESLSKTGRTILKVETYKKLKTRIIEVSYWDINRNNLEWLWSQMSQIETDMASQSLASNHDASSDHNLIAADELSASNHDDASSDHNLIAADELSASNHDDASSDHNLIAADELAASNHD